MNNYTTPLLWNLVITIVLSFSIHNNLSAQTTTWTGNTDTDWNTPGNWSAGVPTTTSDAIIANVTNDPVISANDAVAESVDINVNAQLTITTTGKLTVEGSTDYGVENRGTVENNGTIDIGTTTGPGTSGLINYAAFNNNNTGVINIDRSATRGLYNIVNGIFNNAGTITMGAIVGNGSLGLDNQGSAATFNNNTNGIINIDQSTFIAIYNSGGSSTVNNVGTISIGATAGIGDNGIFNYAEFNNNTNGIINIDRSSDFGIHNLTGTFNNYATIHIGAAADVGSIGIRNHAVFNNNSGSINIDRCNNNAIRNFQGTFTNYATINIGSNAGTSVEYGIQNNALFNNTSGVINIDRVLYYGVFANGGTITNTAEITIGALAPVTTLINGFGSGMFINTTNGTMKGTGTLSALYFSQTGGKLEPGYSPGTMTFTGDEDFSNNIFAMEADGTTTPGVDFDQINVTGTATVGASTFLELVFSYPVEDGESFDILTATSVSGTIPTGNISFSNVGTGNVTAINVSYPGGNIIRVTADTPLPVELVSFKGEEQNGQVLLKWETAVELNNQGFDIERSGKDLQWEKIGFVKSKGSTTSLTKYTLWDRSPLSGQNYYRLRQIDYDGQVEYSKVVSIYQNHGSMMHIAPNPIRDGQFTLSLDRKKKPQSVTLRIFDTNGRLFKSENPGSGSSWTIQCSELPKGFFYLEVQADEARYCEKIMIR